MLLTAFSFFKFKKGNVRLYVNFAQMSSTSALWLSFFSCPLEFQSTWSYQEPLSHQANDTAFPRANQHLKHIFQTDYLCPMVGAFLMLNINPSCSTCTSSFTESPEF